MDTYTSSAWSTPRKQTLSYEVKRASCYNDDCFGLSPGMVLPILKITVAQSKQGANVSRNDFSGSLSRKTGN